MHQQSRWKIVPMALTAFLASWCVLGLVDALLTDESGVLESFLSLEPRVLATRSLAAAAIGLCTLWATRSWFKRKGTEEALRRSEKRFATVFEAVGEALCIIDEDGGRIEAVNAAFEKQYAARSFTKGDSLSQTLPAAFLETAQTLVHDSAKASTSSSRTVETPDADGAQRLSELASFPLPESEMAHQEFLLLLRDLSLEKRCQELMHAARGSYRSLLENVRTPTAIALANGRVQLANRAFRELTGCAGEDPEGPPEGDLVGTDFEEELLRRWAAPQDTACGRERFEFRIRSREGVVKFIAVDRVCISGTNELLLFVTDLSAQKQVEEELSESKATLALVQRISRMGNWEWDVISDTLTWSEEMYRIFWVDPADYVPTYEGYLTAVHPDDKELVIQAVNNALYNKKPFGLDHRIVLADGTIRTISARAEVSFDSQGRPLRVVGTNQDITWRIEAEEALRNSEEKFSKAFHASPDSIVITRAQDGTYIDVNEAFQEMTGYTRDEVLGRSSYADLKLWVDPEARMMMLKLMNQYGHVRNLEVRFRVKSGEIKELLWSADVIEYGGEACLIAISRDVTEQRHLEQELLKSEAKLYMKHEELKNLFQQMEGIRREWEETMDCISDQFILSDQWGKIRRFNRAVEEFSGKAHRDIVGRECDSFLDELGFKRHAESPGVELPHEPTGKWFVVKRYAFPSIDADRTTREVVIISDTSEIHHRSEQGEAPAATSFLPPKKPSISRPYRKSA